MQHLGVCVDGTMLAHTNLALTGLPSTLLISADGNEPRSADWRGGLGRSGDAGLPQNLLEVTTPHALARDRFPPAKAGQAARFEHRQQQRDRQRQQTAGGVNDEGRPDAERSARGAADDAALATRWMPGSCANRTATTTMLTASFAAIHERRNRPKGTRETGSPRSPATDGRAAISTRG